jgi:tetratricopeptide (TPR) repeat protein
MKNNKINFSKELFIPVVNNIKNEKYDKALNLLDQLINQKQDINIINKLKASIYLKKKEWSNSLSNYTKIVDGENSYEITNNMGIALYGLGRLSEASVKFEKSLNINNSYIPAYENLILTYRLLGNYELAIKFITQALKLNPNNKKIKNNLIDIFNYYEPQDVRNSIINANLEINKLNLLEKKKKIIQNFELHDLFEKSEKILEKNNIKLDCAETQIFRKNTLNLNCKRHLKVFSIHKIIPKFCFDCYKVQITLNSIVDLIKLYFYFNNLFLKKNNIRKCIVELRKNISGNYKGYIFTSSIIESEEIINLVKKDLIDKEINLNKIEIKHGCTEYYSEYALFKKTDQEVKNKIYQKEWDNIEKEFDDKNLIKENDMEKIFNNTLNKFNLSDYLIIKNWFLYAKIIGDFSYQEVFKLDIDDKHLSLIQKEQISLRKNNL